MPSALPRALVSVMFSWGPAEAGVMQDAGRHDALRSSGLGSARGEHLFARCKTRAVLLLAWERLRGLRSAESLLAAAGR